MPLPRSVVDTSRFMVSRFVVTGTVAAGAAFSLALVDSHTMEQKSLAAKHVPIQKQRLLTAGSLCYDEMIDTAHEVIDVRDFAPNIIPLGHNSQTTLNSHVLSSTQRHNPARSLSAPPQKRS